MGEKRYYWLKLEKSFFDDKLIKKLRRMAGGDTYCIIYLRLILKSMENNGALYFDGIEGSFAEELALDLDESIENVQALIGILIATNRIEQITEDEIKMLDFETMTGSEAKSTQRARKCRNKKKALQCNTVQQICNTEKEIDKEKELELDKELETLHVNYSEFRELFLNTCTNLPSIRELTDARKRKVKTFLKAFSIDEAKEIFEKANESDFLCGKNSSFKATFDWLINTRNAIKVIEGNYDNNSKKKQNSFCDHMTRNNDMTDLERSLLG